MTTPMQDLAGVGKIDAHTHLAKRPGTPLMSLAEREQYDQVMGISRCILLPSPPERARASKAADLMLFNDDAAQICREHPGQYDWLCNAVPDGTDGPLEELRRCKAMGARGVGEFSARLPLDGPEMRRFLACCEALEMPFLFHMAPEDTDSCYGVVDAPGLPALENILRDFPGLTVLAHSQPVWFELSAHSGTCSPQERNRYLHGPVEAGRLVELLERYPNLYLDLSARSASSALLRDPDFSVEFLEAFSERMIFGTDALVITDVMALGPWLELMTVSGRLTPETYRRIVRDNACRVFRLAGEAL